MTDSHLAMVDALASVSSAAKSLSGLLGEIAPGTQLADLARSPEVAGLLSAEASLQSACSDLLLVAEESGTEPTPPCGVIPSIGSMAAGRPDQSNIGRASDPVPVKPGRHRLLFYHDGFERSYVVYVPSSYDAAAPVPLVFFFHGGQHTASQAETVGYVAAAESAGVILVAPNGTDNTWNAVHCCPRAYNHEIDDVGFVEALVEHVGKSLNIDRSVILAAGGSNGGMLANRVGAELSETFTAIAPGAATIGGSPDGVEPVVTIPAPTQAVSVMRFHGRKDQKVQWAGGKTIGGDRVDISFDEGTKFWGRVDGCESKPKTTRLDYGTRIAYMDCTDGTEVVAITIADLAHGYPTIENSGVDAATMAIDFALEHPR